MEASNLKPSIPKYLPLINLQQLSHDLFINTNLQLNQNTPISTKEMAPPNSNAIFRTILSANLPADQKLRG